jgi:SNF2 family DNA or RNA helicase/uncharacterized Zn finger protein
MIIDGNIIRAKVAGSSREPYDVTIVIPPFTEKDIKKLILALAMKPVIISKLLNRQLDPEMLDIAESKGLKIFPQRWTDFKMACSCPDWAVPCKHLAAVIYKLSAEIDNNPFLVFDLHNAGLIKELEREGIHVSGRDTEVPLLSELLETKKDTPQTPPARPEDAETGAETLNYSSLSPISAPLIQLLADAPVFYQRPGNFRDKYAALLHKTERNAQKILKGKTTLASFITPSRKKLTIGRYTRIEILPTAYGDATVRIDDLKTLYTLPQAVGALDEIPPGTVKACQPSVESLYALLQMCINLIANGAVIPQIVKLDNRQYKVRWLPALISREVRALAGQLNRLFSENAQACVPANDTVNLTSFFLTYLMSLLSESKPDDMFLALFFKEQGCLFRNPGEEALPGSINAWLQRYYITSRSEYRPCLIVDELRDGRFGISIYMERNDGKMNRKIPLRDILTLSQYGDVRFGILHSLAQLSCFIPLMDEHINSRCETGIIFSNSEFTPFLMQVIPAISLLNIDILLPGSLRKILRPRASVRIKPKAKEGSKGFIRLENLLDYDWQVAVGDNLMDEGEFRKLLKTAEGLIKYKANYIYVSPADLEKLHKEFTSAKRLSPLEMLRTVLAEEYNGAQISIDPEAMELIHHLTARPEVPLPQNLKASLRPYQERGFAWMYRNSQTGFGSVLADDMGLGKTLQVITTLLKYKEEKAINDREKALIVAPAGLLANWMAEFEKFAPSLSVMLYHGANRKLDRKACYDIVLTSYSIARSDANLLKKRQWQALVIDEAQNIKNQDTAQSKAIKSIKANTCIAMSGTPVENRLSELWSIMDFANKGFLGNLSEFREAYGNPIQNQNDRAAAGKLKRITAPFMMRRLKSDRTIISDLPDKIEIDCFAHLAAEQASLYRKTLQEAMIAIEGITGADHQSLFVRQGLVLQLILALKQICNHPALFLKNRATDASLSGKAGLLFEKLDTILEANEKVLIFTQFAEMGNMLTQFVAERYGETPIFYHGGCTLAKRKEMVDRFQDNRADRVFILSLKAAGTGLNLTAAAHVIHYDLWWNPAVETQATDRAYRIGQKSNVMVHRFITKGTFEERINDMIQSKKALADMTVAAGEAWIGNLNDSELRDLFRLK